MATAFYVHLYKDTKTKTALGCTLRGRDEIQMTGIKKSLKMSLFEVRTYFVKLVSFSFPLTVLRTADYTLCHQKGVAADQRRKKTRPSIPLRTD